VSYLQGRVLLKKTEDGQTAGPLFKTLYAIHGIPLAWALGLQILYSGQQFAGPLLLKQITTFLDDSVYGLAVCPVSSITVQADKSRDTCTLNAFCMQFFDTNPTLQQ
jgi:hypothetical protein